MYGHAIRFKPQFSAKQPLEPSTAPDPLDLFRNDHQRHLQHISRDLYGTLSRKHANRRVDNLLIYWSAHGRTSTTPNLIPSQFKTGDWLVGLLCLIPINIAVTGQNRFIPLRDGVISPEFEQSLLGADVAHIAEALVPALDFFSSFSQAATRLSFGWYESIFASYMARKVSCVSYLLFISPLTFIIQPVKVVTSMG